MNLISGGHRHGTHSLIGVAVFTAGAWAAGMLQQTIPPSTTSPCMLRTTAKDYAQRLEHDKPDLVVSRMTKSLRKGKVLIDWSQNNGSKTTVAPYSLRARTHPTVSTPVTWDEVESCQDPGNLFFTAPDVLARVEKSGDLFGPLLG